MKSTTEKIQKTTKVIRTVNGSPTVVHNGSWSLTTTNFVDGTTNSNWKQDIAEGRCATTFLTAEKWTRKNYVPLSFFAITAGGARWDGEVADTDNRTSVTNPTSFSISEADSAARTDLVKRANAKVRGFQGLTFLGELRETLSMIRNPANALISKIAKHSELIDRKVRKLRRGEPKWREVVAGGWLEASFGWSPLVSDLHDGLQAITRWDDPRRRLWFVYGIGGREQLNQPISVENIRVGPLDADIGIFEDTRCTVKYRAALQWNPSSRVGFRYWGVSLSDVLPTAWELVPWSFLIDYFSNVGDIIEGLSFNTGMLKWVDRGVERVITRKSLLSSYTLNSTFYGVPEKDKITSSNVTSESLDLCRRHVRREEILGFSSIPNFSFEVPGMGKKAINMAALAALRFK